MMSTRISTMSAKRGFLLLSSLYDGSKPMIAWVRCIGHILNFGWLKFMWIGSSYIGKICFFTHSHELAMLPPHKILSKEDCHRQGDEVSRRICPTPGFKERTKCDASENSYIDDPKRKVKEKQKEPVAKTAPFRWWFQDLLVASFTCVRRAIAKFKYFHARKSHPCDPMNFKFTAFRGVFLW